MEHSEKFMELTEAWFPQAAQLYKAAFGSEPWNDDWSDEEQLMAYIRDIAGAPNSLNFGLFIGGKLAAVSLGSVRHWWEGTNYNIEELCVDPALQRQGTGTRFMRYIEDAVRERGFAGIFLQTDNDKPSYDFYLKNGFSELTEHVSMYRGIR